MNRYMPLALVLAAVAAYVSPMAGVGRGLPVARAGAAPGEPAFEPVGARLGLASPAELDEVALTRSDLSDLGTAALLRRWLSRNHQPDAGDSLAPWHVIDLGQSN